MFVHSFGTAMDINASANGLYLNCDIDTLDPESISGCRVRIGGEWDPVERPRLTITADGPVVAAFEEHLGWKWGGATGPTVDIMHFSISGD